AAVDGVVSPEMCRAVARTYGGVTHRLELIRKLNGVSYINDSIATSPTRTIAGLRAMRAKPILIAGGHDKHVSFDGLADEICERVRALLLTGDTAEQIAIAVRRSVFYDPMRLPIKIVPDLTTAVLEAKAMASPGTSCCFSGLLVLRQVPELRRARRQIQRDSYGVQRR
ncbi:MAG: glutamate ligase domain-containing protein, partial [Oscillospiraceae bacterium]